MVWNYLGHGTGWKGSRITRTRLAIVFGWSWYGFCGIVEESIKFRGWESGWELGAWFEAIQGMGLDRNAAAEGGCCGMNLSGTDFGRWKTHSRRGRVTIVPCLRSMGEVLGGMRLPIAEQTMNQQ